MEIKIKKLRENAIIPSRGSLFAAGYDLYACLDGENITIEPHKSAKIGTGIAAALPAGYFGAIFARSGLATKQNLRPANCVGVVDSDYRGEFIVCLHNDSDEVRIINNGERIAQLVLMPFMEMDFIETDALDETERGVGGFGCTGK